MNMGSMKLVCEACSAKLQTVYRLDHWFLCFDCFEAKWRRWRLQQAEKEWDESVSIEDSQDEPCD